jgi:hypothetical protein
MNTKIYQKNIQIKAGGFLLVEVTLALAIVLSILTGVMWLKNTIPQSKEIAERFITSSSVMYSEFYEAYKELLHRSDAVKNNSSDFSLNMNTNTNLDNNHSHFPHIFYNSLSAPFPVVLPKNINSTRYDCEVTKAQALGVQDVHSMSNTSHVPNMSQVESASGELYDTNTSVSTNTIERFFPYQKIFVKGMFPHTITDLLYGDEKLFISINSATSSDSDIVVYHVGQRPYSTNEAHVDGELAKSLFLKTPYFQPQLLQQIENGPGIIRLARSKHLLFALSHSQRAHLFVYNIQENGELAYIDSFVFSRTLRTTQNPTAQPVIPSNLYVNEGYIYIGFEKSELYPELVSLPIKSLVSAYEPFVADVLPETPGLLPGEESEEVSNHVSSATSTQASSTLIDIMRPRQILLSEISSAEIGATVSSIHPQGFVLLVGTTDGDRELRIIPTSVHDQQHLSPNSYVEHSSELIKFGTQTSVDIKGSVGGIHTLVSDGYIAIAGKSFGGNELSHLLLPSLYQHTHATSTCISSLQSQKNNLYHDRKVGSSSEQVGGMNEGGVITETGSTDYKYTMLFPPVIKCINTEYLYTEGYKHIWEYAFSTDVLQKYVFRKKDEESRNFDSYLNGISNKMSIDELLLTKDSVLLSGYRNGSSTVFILPQNNYHHNDQYAANSSREIFTTPYDDNGIKELWNSPGSYIKNNSIYSSINLKTYLTPVFTSGSRVSALECIKDTIVIAQTELEASATGGSGTYTDSSNTTPMNITALQVETKISSSTEYQVPKHITEVLFIKSHTTP